jgi:hypothetical protein
MIKMIGYWITSFNDFEYIAPQELLAEYPGRTKQRLTEYLEGGRILESYLGQATCRFPNCEHFEWSNGIGSDEFTDGVWAWPEGLIHYVVRHDVRLPDEFISHVMANDVIPRSPDYLSDYLSRDTRDTSESIDQTFWIEWCARNGSGVVRNRINELREEAAQAITLARSNAEAAFEAKCRDMERQMGLALESCQWKRCERRALQGRAFCVEHGECNDLDKDLDRAQSSVLKHFFSRALHEA